MRYSVGLPTDRVAEGDAALSAAAIGAFARRAEELGFDAVYATEHPFPPERWVSRGGHHALDPMVALTAAAAATSTLLLHTNLFVLPLRNPYLAAKAVASLDVVSGGRVILGLGAGYLREEFEALGAGFEGRGERLEAGVAAMRAAWSGRPRPGAPFGDHVALPTPVRAAGPPVWIGGNSRAAMERAVRCADGWSPFPTPPGVARATGTAEIPDAAALARRIGQARRYAEEVGRSAPLEIAFVPDGLSMIDGGGVDPARARSSCKELEGIGVTWCTVALSAPAGPALDAQLEEVADAIVDRRRRVH